MFANFVYFLIARGKVIPCFDALASLFSRVYESIQNSQTLQDYSYFPHFTTFGNQTSQFYEALGACSFQLC